uniref:Sepiapterin reductase n=1 Tax=Strigamia maritima TaxID=126957 RepID=T1IHT9_STRMM
MATGLVSYGRCFCLISGASRGFGRGLAIKLADKLAPGSVLFLVARNAQDLAEVKTIIDEKKRNLSVVVLSMDLKKPDHEVFKVAINSALKQCDAKADEFNTALVVHNVGSLGNINGTTLDVVDINELRSYYDLNLFATILLNSAFFKIFTASSTGKQVVINLSSGAAVTPFKTWIYYSTDTFPTFVIVGHCHTSDPF